MIACEFDAIACNCTLSLQVFLEHQPRGEGDAVGPTGLSGVIWNSGVLWDGGQKQCHPQATSIVAHQC